MKSKNMTLMIIAIGCGLVAALLTAKLSGGNATEMVDVIVAKKELPVGTLLEEKELENMVGISKFPAATLPPDTILKIEDLKNKKLNRTLKTGNFFAQGDVALDLGTKLPEGMYKYAIKIDGVKAASGFVQPGDHVDVQLTETQQNGKVKAGFVLRDVLVLAVDARQTRSEKGEAALQVNAVSLAVSPEQSLYLSAAERRGDVKLVLRNAQNTDKTDVAPKSVIPGFDKEKPEQVTASTTKMATAIYAKAEVPANTFITLDNFGNYFVEKQIREEDFDPKMIHDPSSLRDKFVTRAIEPGLPVFSSWLSAEKQEPMAMVPMEDEKEMLPEPRLKAASAYPRRFEQIINDRHVWFIETAPGQFRHADAPTVPAELKDLPDSSGVKPETDEKKKEEKKADDERGDRAI